MKDQSSRESGQNSPLQRELQSQNYRVRVMVGCMALLFAITTIMSRKDSNQLVLLHPLSQTLQ